MKNDIESGSEDIENEDDDLIKSVLPSTVPENIIELKHSFGYDCKRLFNLCLIDEDTLIFASGNLLHYYSVSQNKFTLRRTVFGGGVGFIIKNHVPEYDYLTIAENGDQPTVFIYQYPEHEVISTLKGGAIKNFTFGTYSNNGELIATQAGYPDYMLTIWNWKTSSIVLRSKAYQNDVLDLTFSKFNPILLATCGMSHVQFWKMAQTFTGLKLKSDLGRFGKTDTCDVLAVYMLADEKVISGCEWGNMLVWEAGLIKVEVTRKARKPCHTKPITRIIWMGNSEVMTIGMDGYARIWFWETVELADPPEDDRFVEIDPIFEFRIGDRNESCECRHLLKANPLDEKDCQYFSQDGNGGIWLCDLNTNDAPIPPKKLFSCHGGRIQAGQASPISPHIATLGADGKLNVYNYETEELLMQEPYTAGGRCLIWLNTSVDASGMVLIVGFEDGVLRQVALELNNDKMPKAKIHLLNAIKPHSAQITCLGVSLCGSLLVSGALDETIFLFEIRKNDSDYIKLVPLGFVSLAASPTCFNWNHKISNTLLVGCITGEVYELVLPELENIDLKKFRPTWRVYAESSKMLKFQSVKSRIRRDLEKKASLKRKARKLAAKKKEMKRLMEINPGLQFDENALADSSEDEEESKLPPLHIPDPPNQVIWLQYTNQDTIWISMGGYDAGYVYEYKFGEEESITTTVIPEAEDVEINSYLYIDTFLIFGMQTGQVRINAVKSDFRQLNDFWAINMHDNLNGNITSLFTSHDGKFLFSVGYDGNIFYYQWNGPIIERKCPPPIPFRLPLKIAKDIEDTNQLSLEEVKIKENLIKLRAFEDEERRRLDPSFSVMQLQIDWVTDKMKDFYQESLNAVLEKLKDDVTGACQDAQKLYELMFEKLEYIPFEVFAISKEDIVRTFRLPKLLKVSESINEEIVEEEEAENERSISSTCEAESRTTLVGSKISNSSSFLNYDYPEKVLLKLYIRILELFSLLKQIKAEELEHVMEICGEDYEEEELFVDDSDSKDFEEEGSEYEEERIPLVEKAIRFLKNAVKENVETKNLEIEIILQNLHSLKSEYNNGIINLKTTKSRLYDKYKHVKEDILKLELEVSLPFIREIVMYNEYPEEILKEPFIPLRSFESILWEKPIKNHVHQLEEENVKNEEDVHSEETFEESMENGEEDSINDVISEEWIADSEDLVKIIEEQIYNYDEELKAIKKHRLNFEIEIKYLEILEEISTKELTILQESEVMEKLLVERDEAAKRYRYDISSHIKRLKNEIDVLNKNLQLIKEDIRKIQADFNEAVKGNKFFKFLKRIFDKKFKPEKEKNPDDDSTSESSSDDSSTDEDDAGSGDSGNITAIRLDESHCPAGCDRKLYDLAFELRTERHSLEQKIHHGQKSNELKKIEIEEYNNKIPAVEELCLTERTNLLAFRRQKDQKLRAVETEVISGLNDFGLDLKELENSEENEEYIESLIAKKKREMFSLREELQRPIEVYREKLKILLHMLEEREQLRKKQPSIVEIAQPKEEMSLVSIVRPPTPPPPFDFEAYAEEKILKLVQRFFVRYLSKHISEPYMRKYIPKVARCLGNIGRNFTCELANNIIEVIVENLQRIIPKKYLMHASIDDIRSLFKDVVAVFEFDPVEVDPVAVITEAVEKCLKIYGKMKCANKTQRIILEISKILIEELPMNDFRNSDTIIILSKLLGKEAVIVPNCLNVDTLVDQISAYAKEHLLSAVTFKILRVYAEELLVELTARKTKNICSTKPKEKAYKDIRRKKRAI